ncbi:hypothetical protein RFI_18162 [Reticulomyxa filosa]|uniref:Uncharacterized protein n=1 Tax=Reticulomyxa filosa TaxID=46433 RepID=X6N171_RETFI|nr:hypothetical protein RFI_18162 [Reticulomyxa filosa]|eukprot:ETO19077.1 hypothetical protein RFI_18162 [Reticulomyxa filosa]
MTPFNEIHVHDAEIQPSPKVPANTQERRTSATSEATCITHSYPHSNSPGPLFAQPNQALMSFPPPPSLPFGNTDGSNANIGMSGHRLQSYPTGSINLDMTMTVPQQWQGWNLAQAQLMQPVQTPNAINPMSMSENSGVSSPVTISRHYLSPHEQHFPVSTMPQQFTEMTFACKFIYASSNAMPLNFHHGTDPKLTAATPNIHIHNNQIGEMTHVFPSNIVSEDLEMSLSSTKQTSPRELKPKVSRTNIKESKHTEANASVKKKIQMAGNQSTSDDDSLSSLSGAHKL